MNSTTEAPTSVDVPANAVVVDNCVWIATDWGQFRVEKSRWGTYSSYDKDGEQLVTGMTEDSVIACTPMHLHANSADYDGCYDVATFSSYVSGKL